ncbi:MAG: hypothetical protein Q8L20_03835 [Gammaproteobacteria bacterium]|nr:hypothetical protein [Gammaproteobacteria bacterium]
MTYPPIQPDHSTARTPLRSVYNTVRRVLSRALILGVWFSSGVVFAQQAGPIPVTGSGGTEATVTPSLVGSGGEISTAGLYTVHRFTSGGVFLPPEGVTSVEVLVVGGGGGGGRAGNNTGTGGGGGGGVQYSANTAVSGPVTVTVGAAGLGATTNANGGSGGNSIFNSTVPITAVGGGGGATANVVGLDGGSGGGGGSNGTLRAGGTGSQGNNGGSSFGGTNPQRAGGGGGGGDTGGNGPGGDATAGNGGAGGDGYLSSITGVGTRYAAGGGGSGPTSGGAGGLGGGGDGGTTAGASATVENSGSGGGGGRNGNNGGDGADGVVIVRYLTPTTPAANYRVHVFTTNQNFNPPTGVNSVDVLAVGGGGGGGGDRRGGGGGGGGGVSRVPNVVVTPGTNYAVGVGTVGAGGTGTGSGSPGGNSTFNAVTVVGNGGGGGGRGDTPANGGNGGSGGGAGGPSNTTTGGTATQGFPGAVAFDGGNSDDRGGGGGGAGGTGTIGTGTNTGFGGAGGPGLEYGIYFGTGLGAAGWVAGGGGGGKRDGNGGIGGPGGGGSGSGAADAPSAGTNGTGGGGGGRGGDTDAQTGAAGGTGTVAVRYRPATMEIIEQLTPPRKALIGAAFSEDIVIELMGPDGITPLVGVTVTATRSFGTGTLGGTTAVVTDSNGHAIFNNLSISSQTGNHRISFTVPNSTDFVETENINVVSYRFEITHALTAGVCSSATAVTITVYDSTNAVVEDFAGVVTITNNLGNGDYTVNTGTPANLDNGTADDGEAEYEFDPADQGVLILDFTTTDPGTYEFNAVSGTITTQNYTIDLDVLACEFRISHDLSAGSCAPETIQIGVYTSAGLVTDYVGNVTLSSAGVANGNWSTTGIGGDTNGTLVNPPPNDGIATYNFVLADGGNIAVNFRANVGTANFNVVAAAGNVSPPSGANDPELVIYSCSFRISHDGQANVCSVEEITIGVYANNALVNFAGDINISTATVTGGNWTKTANVGDALGTLKDGPPDGGPLNDGAAVYTFVAADAGEIKLNFQDNTAETVNFNITAAGVSAPVAPYDDNLVVRSCTFRISHSGSTDVCSIEEVTITLVDFDGVTVENYTGNINLSTSTGDGTWRTTGVFADAQGTLSDPVDEDGNASYQFVLADQGSIKLNFRHMSSAGPVNINISDSYTFDPQNPASPHDQNLSVAVCTVEIVHNGSNSACEVATVEFTIRDSGGNIATNYIGTLSLSTSTNHGNWYANDADGFLVDTPNDDNGVATYQFVTSDAGVAVLDFSNPYAEAVNFNAEDGAILVDPDADANLFITSCLPDLFGTAQCAVDDNDMLTIPARSGVASQRGRMVLMVIAGAGDTLIDDAFFNTVPMVRIKREVSSTGEGSILEIWGILDAQLPISAGSYEGTYTGGPAGSAMCLLAVDQVRQVLPVEASPIAAAGPVNGDQGAGTTRSTTFTTTANNSLVVSAVNFDGLPFFTLEPPAPDYMTRIWGQGATPIADPGGLGARFGGSIGRQPAAGVNTAIDVLFPIAAAVGTQLVAAFEPLISGAPLAGSYKPVVLYKTFSGNMSYRAIGNTLRSTSNATGPAPLGCNFVDFSVGSSTNLDLPDDSIIKAAYLYWAGSGDDSLGQVDSEVTFVAPSNHEESVSAQEIFIVDDVGVANNMDFFAGYRDVTTLMEGNGTYTVKNLVVQDGDPWESAQGCAGGWALVVVFEHQNERLRVLNLFHGFQPFQDSSFTLVPRNFRMASHDPEKFLPNGQVTHITLEGDETQLMGDDGTEGLGIQDEPNSPFFTNIISSLNPAGQEFNSTITYPIYAIDDDTGYFEFQSTAGPNGDGYGIDFPGPHVLIADRIDPVEDREIGSTWGWDIDTHYLQGANPGEVLYEFGFLGEEAEQLTTRYRAARDLVMLISEVISVTNFPIADLEVFKSEVGTFKVNTTGRYEILVTNNGNGGFDGGFADGEVIVADILPAGMTFANAGDVGGEDWSCSVTLDPGAFTCRYDIAEDWYGGAEPEQLAANESLPLITVDVVIGDSFFFPDRNNNAKNSVRILHSGGAGPGYPCTAAIGLIPEPTTCLRSPQFDNVNDLEGGIIDVNDLDDKQENNNNVDSVTTVVKGVEVDLRMNKFVGEIIDYDEINEVVLNYGDNGILEIGEIGLYVLRVTNAGPDATTAPITVTDLEPPAGVQFISATGIGWSCPTPPGNLSCTHADPLGIGASTDILVQVQITGADGFPVSNTATVNAGPFNFDINPGNNSDTDLTQIVGPPVASQEKFLMSVSSLGGLTSIGGLTDFEDHDYIIYDPVTDTATMFLDNSYGFDGDGFDIRDADAVHLMKNGQIVISAAQAGSTVGTNALPFEPGDLVVYDPIIGTARMLFDGSTLFGGVGDPAEVNITAVYLQGDCRLDPPPYNCTIIFAATPAAGGSTIGSNELPFTSADLISYNPLTGVASLFFEGATYFAPEDDVTINGFYLRVDPNNSNANINTLVISASNANGDTITIGGIAEWEPDTGTLFTHDDVTQINITEQETGNLFLGDTELGIFQTNGDPDDLYISALHVIEDRYIGHFRISEVGGEPTVCSEAGVQIRISKHEGLSHDRDTDYFGSIRLTTNTNKGSWSKITGGGAFSNGVDTEDGVATYTFVPGDGGTVILALSHPDPGVVNVDVTNGIAREGHPPGVGPEAPTITFDQGVILNYRDNFNVASFGNQNGSSGWSGNWVETDLIAGVAAGDVRVTGGAAVFTRTGGTTQPSLMRAVDLSGATLDAPLLLSFNYAWANLNLADEFVVEARHTSVGNPAWQQVAFYKRGTGLPNTLSGNAAAVNLNVSAVLAGTPTATTQIRFRINTGYATTGTTFSIDDVKLSGSTTSCNIAPLGVHHYEIEINGITSGTASGVACVASDVKITAHDVGHGSILPGAIPLTLRTSTNKGIWSRVLVGSGSLGATVNGEATYNFPADENSVTFRFSYTDPAVDPEIVNINVEDGSLVTEIPAEDPNLAVSQVGLRMLNFDTDDDASPIPLQIAGKPSDVNPLAAVILLQFVTSSDDEPGACEVLFDVGQTLEFEFAAVCDNPGTCNNGGMDPEIFELTPNQAAPEQIPLIDDGDPINYAVVNMELENYGGNPSAPIVIRYTDVGEMVLHASFDIPLDDELLPPALAPKSGDRLTISRSFIVRPFAFDIDFEDDRADDVDQSYAADHTGSLWKIAGESFSTTVTAVGWEAQDDTNNDGIPDAGADLSDNRPTPNFDQDSGAANYRVMLSVDENRVEALGGDRGILTERFFDAFTSGFVEHTISYNEVGIIDLSARIVNNHDTTEIPYMNTENVRGLVRDVGRFYPNLFTVNDVVLSSRINMSCSPESLFTYMGEEFELELELTAKGLSEAGTYTTVNYRGVYAKLDTFAELGLVAIRDIDGDIDQDMTARLANVSIPETFAGTWTNGVLVLSGNMIFERDNPAVPDGPFATMQIAFKPAENGDAGVTIDPERDGLTPTDVLNVDLDDGMAEPGDDEFFLIAEHEFRYGRLIINNAYGPETEDLALTFVVEYFDGSRFVRNTLDSCTFINVDDLGFVPGTYDGDLDDGDTILTSPDTVTFLEGQTQGLEDVLLPLTPKDYPLQTSAPGEGNSGTVDVELDLDAAGLKFLSFEWDDLDENDDPGEDYDDNPQGQIEFGQFRNHDRVINWQEIYNRPTTP